LGNVDVTNVVIDYPRQFSVAVHVLVEGDNSGNVPSVVLEARNASGGIVTSSLGSGNNTPLVLTVSDGEHKISVRNVPAGYVLKSMRYGTIDLMEAPLKVDGPITWEIIVRLARR
jgi:hypothetical protein